MVFIFPVWKYGYSLIFVVLPFHKANSGTKKGFLSYFRKKYVQRLQIRHSYGDDDEDRSVSEDMATAVTEAAMANGTVPTAPVLDPVPAPAGAEVDIGGKKCKWCGSTTHQRKSHKDCPCNSTS